MKPVSQRKSTLAHAFRIARRNGLNPQEARWKTRKMLRQLEGVRGFRQKGLTFERAFWSAKFDGQVQFMQKRFLALNSRYVFEPIEAWMVFELLGEIQHLMHMKQENLIPIFARLRFERPCPPIRNLTDLHERTRRLTQEMWQEIGEEKYAENPSSAIDLVPEEGSREEIEQGENFFTRMQNENGERRIENQRFGLRVELKEVINAYQERFPWSRLQKGLLDMERPGEEAFEKLREKIPNFDTLDKSIQSRIAQEYQAQKLGDWLATLIRKVLSVPIYRLPFQLPEGYIPWILLCLERNDNRKYLAQLAKEWFSKGLA